jgi:hypothetical protein
VPTLTLAHVKLGAALQSAGRVVRPEVTDNPLARLPSSVVNVMLIGVVVFVETVTDVGLTVPTTLSSAVDRYGMLTVPVFCTLSLFRYE